VQSRKLLKKADALLKKEKGTIYKDPGGKISICLAYPNTYHVGMSNLGFQGVYSMLNDFPDVLCERVFLPDAEDIEEYRRTGTALFSLESKRPLAEFDMLAFSVSFENDYPNIMRMLRLAGFPLLASERASGWPLLLYGGVMAFSNPEPLADFFDVVFIGEAEPLIPPFIEAVRRSSDRESLLKDLLKVKGIYIPSLYKVDYLPSGLIEKRTAVDGAPERVERVFAPSYREFKMRQRVITPETEFANMRLIELIRGCPWGCAFCLAGQVYNPPRRKPKEVVIEEIREAQGEGARVGLIAPSISDYSGIMELLEEKDVEFSITSLRSGKKSIELLPALKRHKSLSIAAEAGMERLRKVINKRISEEDILETSRAILENGINLRLYFMVGLPTETDEDVEGIIELVKRIRKDSIKGKITLTVSTFVPKPFTPFERHSMARPEVVKERLKKIKKGLLGERGVSVFHDVPKYAYMQGLFALGDRSISRVLSHMSDGTDYKTALKESGVGEEFYIFREKEKDEKLPWDFIEK
jgi:radical SAM superfamily enzyme YgiQ (UPF0313 family)